MFASQRHVSSPAGGLPPSQRLLDQRRTYTYHPESHTLLPSAAQYRSVSNPVTSVVNNSQHRSVSDRDRGSPPHILPSELIQSTDNLIHLDLPAAAVQPPGFQSTPHPNSVISRNQSLEENDDPFDASYTESMEPSFVSSYAHTGSTQSTPMEIFLGPQLASFVDRRRQLGLQETSPSRPSSVGLEPTYPQKYSQKVPITIRPADDSVRQDLIVQQSQQTEAVHSPGVQTRPSRAQPAQLSKWRMEQIRCQKPMRIVTGAHERPIPVLHGPLSLPYARNPSGVDATVADQSSYLSHVFGLRAVSTADRKESNNDEVVRSVSGSTVFSHNSGSTLLSSGNQTNSTNITDPLTHSASVSSVESINSRPYIVRDYNQVIGLKKEVTQLENSKKHPGTKFTEKLSVERPADLRSHLGVSQQPLSPIPGSPAEHAQAGAVFEDATGSSCSQSLSRTKDTDSMPIPESEYVTLHLVEPASGTRYTVSIPKASYGQVSGIAPRAVSGEMSTSSKVSPSQVSSKADASLNWRARTYIRNTSEGSSSISISSPHMPPAPAPSVSGTPVKNGGSDILRLEHLYEKFGQLEQTGKVESTAMEVKVPPVDAVFSTQQAITDRDSKPISQTTSTVLGETPKRKLNATPKPLGHSESPDASNKKMGRAPTTTKPRSSPKVGKDGKASGSTASAPARARGTPGAGKLLKRSSALQMVGKSLPLPKAPTPKGPPASPKVSMESPPGKNMVSPSLKAPLSPSPKGKLKRTK